MLTFTLLTAGTSAMTDERGRQSANGYGIGEPREQLDGPRGHAREWRVKVMDPGSRPGMTGVSRRGCGRGKICSGFPRASSARTSRNHSRPRGTARGRRPAMTIMSMSGKMENPLTFVLSHGGERMEPRSSPQSQFKTIFEIKHCL